MTSNSGPTLERIARRVSVPEPAYERLLRRRDRKRRNQRITAGVVGIAVFVAAVWIVTSGGVFNRTQTGVVPGGAGTGPAETGPAETGPAGSGDPGDPFSVGDGFVGLPPESAALSEPVTGELVASDDDYRWHVRVYADGRLIWQHGDSLWLERRLTPQGVDLLRSQPDLVGEFDSLPESVWEENQAKQYVAARYGVCTSQEGIRSLPQRALDLLGDLSNDQAIERGEVEFFAGDTGSRCPAVTVEEARQLDEILRENGFRRTEESGESVWYEFQDLNPYIVVTGLLPDGTLAQSGGA
jgi:hypothetical protein